MGLGEVTSPSGVWGNAPKTPKFKKMHIRQRFSSLLGIPVNGWTLIHAGAFLCVLLPLVSLAGNALSPAGEHWPYVSQYMLPTYLAETFSLAAGSSLLAFGLGVALAWCMSMYDFAGKRFFEITLILPLAVPPYIAAYTYDGLTGYTGIIQTFFRNSFDIKLTWLGTGISPLCMAIWVFCITLFPYVYLITRTFLVHQSSSVCENALLLGGSRVRIFTRVGLPLLLPAAGAGTILVCLEVLNDFGVASFYGLNTFTTAIFSSWFGMGDSDTAVKLAVILLAIVLVVLLGRKLLHNARRYHIVSTKEKGIVPRRVSRVGLGAIYSLCGLACLMGFGLPLVQMLLWFGMTWQTAFTPAMGQALAFTLETALPATAIILFFATGAVNAARLFGGRFTALVSQGTTLGYAIPSAVLAISIITFFVWADSVIRLPFGVAIAGQLSMSSLMLVFAYAVRFFTIGYQPVEAGFAKTGRMYTDASRTLGRGVTATFFLVDLPLIRHALFTGAVLIFIDIIKELPLSLLLRPFNTETLGTTVYQFANNEALEETALPSLCIVLSGALFIVLMNIWEKKDNRHVSGN